ncbi:MAG: mitochondrial fission ELM1 family protein [Desulfobacterales bacterium]
MTEPLSIVAFLDGRRGHEKQTRGVLQALAVHTPIATQYRTLPPLSWVSAVRNWAAYTGAAVFGCKSASDSPADLIIGSGAYTHIPMLLLGKASGGKVVTCMSPDPLLIGKMDLCFVPSHDRTTPSDNIFVTTGPPNPTAFTDTHDPARGLMLVGGIDKGSHRWDSKAVAAQLESIVEKDPSIVWTISSSPRTPEDMNRLLDDLAANQPRVDFIRSEATPDGWIEDAYAQNQTVWVTADSISMIFEALTAGCRVGLLPMQWKKKNSKFSDAERHLIENGWVRTYDMWLSGNDGDIGSLRLDEADRCAKEILKRWWPDRLP